MMKKEKTEGSCSLCSTPLSSHSVREAGVSFCCLGCRTVFQVLKTQGALQDYDSHPLFLQAVRSGLISNPHLIETLGKKEKSTETRSLFLEIGEMWCPSCAEVIQLVLMQEEGVQRCSVDYTTDLASIRFDPKKIGKDEIIKRIRALGYKPSSLDAENKQAVSKGLFVRLIVALFCVLNLMMFSYPIYAEAWIPDVMGYAPLLRELSLVVSLPLLFVCAWPIFRRAATSFIYGMVGMELLVSVGIISAFFLSVYEVWTGGEQVYFDSMGAVIVFVLLGRVIESKAKFDAKQSLFRMVRALPKRARKRFSDGSEQFVSMKEVSVGDLVVVHLGEKIPIEGVVVEGKGTSDQSLLTGEAIPIGKKVGDDVLGGAILTQGSLIYRVTATQEDSVLKQMLGSIEGELRNKENETRLVDRVAGVFTPAVFLIAMGTLFFSGWIPAITVLLIACPCAIGIATPIVESRLLHAFGGLGVIVRNRTALGRLAQLKSVVFDKTGTVTEGKFRVLSGTEELKEKQKEVLMGLAFRSTHPICTALAQSLRAKPAKFDEIVEFPGHGMEGQLNEQTYRLGSLKWLGVENEEQNTQVGFAIDGKLIATMTLGDQVKSGIMETLQKMDGIKRVLLSGDRKQVVTTVSSQLGFDEYFFEKTPFEKREVIEELKKEGGVLMIGDGLNDALALSTADVGVSVLSATDLSVQASDLLLTHDQLDVLPRLITLSKQGKRIIKQNLAWAFFYNIFGIGLAVSGILTPLYAAVAMVLSSSAVVLNARRITTQGELFHTSQKTLPQTPLQTDPLLADG